MSASTIAKDRDAFAGPLKKAYLNRKDAKDVKENKGEPFAPCASSR